MHTFKLPVEVMIGPVGCSFLGDITDKRILIICDAFLASSVNLNEITSLLTRHNQVDIYSDVKPDPTVDDVANGIYQLNQFTPDILIAYGGGSAIDLTKAVRLFASKVDLCVEKFIAIPTTSGTGSEVTSASVVSIPEKQIKVPLFSDDLLPDVALLDAQQTLTVPAAITANTGLDVLTHALEALVSSNSNDFTDALAEKAIALVFDYLPDAYRDGNNLEARSKIHHASSIAGIAFNHAGLGMVHAVAHQLGGQFHVPHGLANALVLIPVIKLNMRDANALKKYAAISRQLNFCAYGESDEHCAHVLIDKIAILMATVDIAANYQKCHFEHASQAVFTEMVEHALNDITLATNPILPSRNELLDIISKAVKKGH